MQHIPKKVSTSYQVKSPLKLHPFTFFSPHCSIWRQLRQKSPTNGASGAPGPLKGCRGNSAGTEQACTLTHAHTQNRHKHTHRLSLAVRCSRPHANGALLSLQAAEIQLISVSDGVRVNHATSQILSLRPTFPKELEGRLILRLTALDATAQALFV